MLGDVTWQWTPGAVGIWVAVIGLAAWWIRGIPDRRRARTEADGSLRKDLLARISTLEGQRATDRRECLEEQAVLHGRIRDLQAALDGVMRQFVLFQMTVAQAIPPSSRSPEIDAMIESLKTQGLSPVGRAT